MCLRIIFTIEFIVLYLIDCNGLMLNNVGLVWKWNSIAKPTKTFFYTQKVDRMDTKPTIFHLSINYITDRGKI